MFRIRALFHPAPRYQPCRCGGLATARALYRRFHCFPAGRIVRMRYPRAVPRVMVALGKLRGLIYSSDRGSPGCPRTFIHMMRRPPLLASDPRGTQLHILGGRYRITRRGIED